jgi:hypothetical protein
MNLDQVNRNIQSVESELEMLLEKREALEKQIIDNPLIPIAEEIYRIKYKKGDTDGAWYYEKWSQPGYMKNLCLHDAQIFVNNLDKTLDYSDFNKILEIAKEILMVI